MLGQIFDMLDIVHVETPDIGITTWTSWTWIYEYEHERFKWHG